MTRSSCRFYMSMKVDDLRHELASRDQPTEGLKKDLAWRLASLDDAHCFHSLSLPQPISTSSSMPSSKEGMLATEDYNVQTTEVRDRDSKRSSPSRIASSLPSVQNHDPGDNDQHISNSGRSSIVSTNAFLSILAIVFLLCILWHHIPSSNIRYFTKSIDNSYAFLSSRINCQGFMRSSFQI